MKIGIVGGTFNPIHLGHLMLGEYAYKECGLDEIWFMPNGNPPHKDRTTFLTTMNQRREMIEAAIKNVEYFRYSSYEVDKNEISYSYRTLNELNIIYPDCCFYFIIGSDSLFAIESWKRPELLMKECTLLVACRSGLDISKITSRIEYLITKYECRIEVLQMPLLEISSSEIRNRTSIGKSIKYVVPDDVRSYIEKYGLYIGGKE